jgi:phage FluMu protein Com
MTPMIRITCTNCQKLLSLDETKLPMSEVSVPCPVCKTKLLVDRRKLEAGAQPQAQQPAAPHAPAADADDGEGFGEKALIVGGDHPALRHAAKLIGCIPLHMPTAQQARDFFVQEYPPVVMLNPPQITPPPLESMQPIVALTPVDRRKAFFILFSDNLRTLDGNAAFLYGVNLVVAFKDLGAFQQIYREALAYHERLYAPMNAVLKQLNAV